MLRLLENEQFDELYQLFLESFPVDEFRPYEAQLALLNQENYRVYIFEQKQTIAAFFCDLGNRRICFFWSILQ